MAIPAMGSRTISVKRANASWGPHRPTDVVRRRLEADADAMWSFGKKKAKKQWLSMAMDATTRQSIALHGGERSRESAQALWAEIPLGYREQAMFQTDPYEAYTGVIPAEQHQAMTKKARKTNHSKRVNNTLRQRVARLVREIRSCFKKLAHHLGAMQYIICAYNLTRVTTVALPVEHYPQGMLPHGSPCPRRVSPLLSSHPP